jgi:hypothetical protein
MMIPDAVKRDMFSIMPDSSSLLSEIRLCIFLVFLNAKTTVSEAINPANRLNRRAGFCDVNFDKVQPQNINMIEPGAPVIPRHAAAAEYSLASHQVIDGYDVDQ